jgi:protein O-mannosyl-transferase
MASGAALGAVVVLVCLGSLQGAFVFDDIPAIVENPTLRAPGDVAGLLAPPGDEAGTVGGRPVLNLSLALCYAVSGTNGWSYHALNLLIHVCAALTLFGLVRRTLAAEGSRGEGAGEKMAAEGSPTSRSSGAASLFRASLLRPRGNEATLVAFVVALLWAVHPLQTEAVTYVVQRAESLMGLFYLLTLYGFVRHVGPESPAGPAGGGARRLWAAVAVFACLLGMATKEVMVSAPLAVLVYDRAFVSGSLAAAWRRRRGLYLGLAASWVVLAVLVAGTHGRGGSAGFGAPAGVWPYALTQCRAIVHYLRLAFWPDRLVFDYGTALVQNLRDVLPQILLLVALFAGSVSALIRRPRLGFPAIAFFALLAPSSSFIPIATEPVAEHRMYLPLAAVSALVAVAVFAALARFAPRAARAGCCVLGAAAALGLGAATVRRNRDYRSEIALWTDTVAKLPSNPRAHNNLGQALLAAGDPARAMEEFTAAAGVDPAYAPAQYNLGAMLLDAHRPAEAIPHLERALSAPRHQAELRLYLGEAYERTGACAPAAARYREALRLAPGSVEAAFGLGNNLAAQGRYAEAVDALRLAAAGAPERAQIRNNLANALRFSGRTPEAIAEYREALKRDPENAAIRENLEQALAQARREADR